MVYNESMTWNRFLTILYVASLPRYWRRWIVTCFVLCGPVILFYMIDANHASYVYESQIGNGTGPEHMTVHLSILTVLSIVALITSFVVGLVRCIFRKISDRRLGGVTFEEGGLFQRWTGRVRPVYVPFPASAPIYSASADLARFGRPRTDFDHLLDD